MIKVTYAATRYTPSAPVTRYVRRDAIGQGYTWCEQSNLNRRYDLRQGTCDASDLPDAIRAEADAARGQAFGYVLWPMEGN